LALGLRELFWGEPRVGNEARGCLVGQTAAKSVSDGAVVRLSRVSRGIASCAPRGDLRLLRWLALRNG
jgi:hypothetical protein